MLKLPTIAEARADHQLILVAEDDTINQKVILKQLNLLGYAAELAADGAEALSMWRTGKYGLLITDIHMPEMDGYALTEAIRKEEKLSHQRTPILALTANAVRGEMTRALALGMDEYLTKPLQLHLLEAAVQKRLLKRSDLPVPLAPVSATNVEQGISVINVNVLRNLG